MYFGKPSRSSARLMFCKTKYPRLTIGYTPAEDCVTPIRYRLFNQKGLNICSLYPQYKLGLHPGSFLNGCLTKLQNVRATEPFVVIRCAVVYGDLQLVTDHIYTTLNAQLFYNNRYIDVINQLNCKGWTYLRPCS